MSSDSATQNMSTNSATADEIHDAFVKNVNSLKERQFRFVMANSSQTHVMNPGYAAPELYVPLSPRLWMIEYKQAGGSHTTSGYKPSRLQGLMEMSANDPSLNPIVEYINNSDDPHIIWELEKIFKFSQGGDWIEWDRFLFSVTGSLFNTRVTNGSWSKWAAKHTKSWSDSYEDPPIESVVERPIVTIAQ